MLWAFLLGLREHDKPFGTFLGNPRHAKAYRMALRVLDRIFPK